MRARFGGQAGASARIENYLGFPDRHLGPGAGGTRVHPGAEVRRAHADSGRGRAPRLRARGRRRAARAAARRRAHRAQPHRRHRHAARAIAVRIARISRRWKGAASGTGPRRSRRRCAPGEEVVLVGGGNSAGQAAVFLAGHAAKVWMLVRGAGLAASMSKYLIDRIAATANIELRTRTEIVGLDRLAAVGRRSRCAGGIATRDRRKRTPIRNVFLFLGRRSGDRMAEGLRRDARRQGLRQTGPGAGDARNGGACRSKPACPASSRSATCAPDRSSASAARSAKAPRWSRRSTRSSRLRIPSSGFTRRAHLPL